MRFIKSALGLLLAGSLSACLAGPDGDLGSKEQLLRGHIPLGNYSSEVIGVRVVAAGQAVAATKIDAAGNFSLRVPQGRNYAFEVVTTSGSHTLLTGPIHGNSPLSFDVCDPGDDFDLGDIDPFDFEEIDGDDVPWSDTEDDCTIPDWLCGEDGNPDDCWVEPPPCDAPGAEPDFCWVDPLPCDVPGADPDFCWEEPPFCDDPASDPDLCWEEPPFCDDPDADPIGCIEEPLPCDAPGADPDFCLEEPPFPCEDPGADPDTCGGEPPPFPCDEESGDCGFGGCENGYDDPTCWPEIDICILDPDGELNCDEDIGAAPEFPLPDFGCEGDSGSGDDESPPLPPELPEPV